MPHRVCPWWLGYLLLLPVRKFWQSPRRLLGPFVREGMTVLEPGPGMGFFTLDLARLVGPAGRVVAVDVQERMLRVLRRRARRAGLLERIEIRRADPGSLGLDDLTGRADLALAIFVVHEMPDAGAFFAEAHRVLKPGGSLLFAEPKSHVPEGDFERSLATAAAAGFTSPRAVAFQGARAVMLGRAPQERDVRF
jgi:ubiquinone/menaquinone biosynthesis C-methylase UbiE